MIKSAGSMAAATDALTMAMVQKSFPAKRICFSGSKNKVVLASSRNSSKILRHYRSMYANCDVSEGELQ